MFNILHTKTSQKRMEEKTKEYKQEKKNQKMPNCISKE